MKASYGYSEASRTKQIYEAFTKVGVVNADYERILKIFKIHNVPRSELTSINALAEELHKFGEIADTTLDELLFIILVYLGLFGK